MRGILGRAAFAVTMLTTACSAFAGTTDDRRRAPGAADLPANWRESLTSEDPLEVIGTLVGLAEAGRAASEAEEAIAGLLAETQRGRQLSRWAYYALACVCAHPERHIDQYVKVVRWQPRPEGLGRNEMIVDHGGGTPKGLVLPRALEAVSDAAWATCIRAVFERRRTARHIGERGRIGWALTAMRAPPGVIVPIAVRLLEDTNALTHERRRAAILAGTQAFKGKMHVDALVTHLKDPDAFVRGACALGLS